MQHIFIFKASTIAGVYCFLQFICTANTTICSIPYRKKALRKKSFLTDDGFITGFILMGKSGYCLAALAFPLCTLGSLGN
jgi:hypothetical protein